MSILALSPCSLKNTDFPSPLSTFNHSRHEGQNGGRAALVKQLDEQKERNTRTNLVLGTDAGSALQASVARFRRGGDDNNNNKD